MKKYPLKLREMVIKAYLSKISIRGAEYTFNVHNSIISKWIKRCGNNIKKLQEQINKSKDPKIIDVLEADELFTILMGEKVEPRREFIENHAKEVVNLDI